MEHIIGILLHPVGILTIAQIVIFLFVAGYEDGVGAGLFGIFMCMLTASCVIIACLKYINGG